MQTSSINKSNILLVDDNMENRELFKFIFQSGAHSISECKNGEEAVSTALINKFDIIVMDISMPIMDGYEAAKKIRVSNNYIPIVFWSSDDDRESKNKAIESGANYFMPKSFGSKNIITFIEMVLFHHKN